MREVDGLKIDFVTHDAYFESIASPSMFNIAKETGADVVLLLGPGKTEKTISDEYIRALLHMNVSDIEEESTDD